MKPETREMITLLELVYALRIDSCINDIKEMEPEHYNQLFDRFVTCYTKLLDDTDYENRHTENVISAVKKMDDPFDAGLSILRNHITFDDSCLDEITSEYWHRLIKVARTDPDFL